MARCATSPILTTLLLAVVLLLVPAAPAHANYTGAIASTSCGYNPGSRDRNNTLYMACGQSVRIVTAAGVESTAWISEYVGRVAPSPDGSYLYSIDGSGAFRFTRAANGNYYRDGFSFTYPPGWQAKGWRVCGWGIASDAYGNVYLSNGGWCPNGVAAPNMILKYRPDGSLVTTFGDFGIAQYPGHLPGYFRPNMSIAVTADGSRIWVADEINARVQVFERAADNVSYAYRTMWSGEGTNWSGQLGAVYGVAVDPWGYGYVTQTTTKIIWRIDPEAHDPVNVAYYAGNDQVARPHTLAVDARGTVYVGEWGWKFHRTTAAPGPLPALPPEPRPDHDAPIVRTVTAPVETTTASVRVTVDATDDIGVTHMRIADESGEWRAWTTYQASFDHALSDGIGAKVIYVQVRDTAGRESNVTWAIVQRRPVPDNAHPVVSFSAPRTTTTSNVTLSIDASDDIGVTHIRFATEEGTFGDWQPWSSGVRTYAHTLTAGLGPRIVAIQVRDAAYKVSSTAQLTVVVALPPAPVPVLVPADGGGPDVVTSRDRVAPRITSLRVPSRSCSRRIVLRLTARDDRRVSHVRIANENGRFGRWRAYRASTVHFLSSGATRKVVYLQVRDAAGNISRPAGRRTMVVRCR